MRRRTRRSSSEEDERSPARDRNARTQHASGSSQAWPVVPSFPTLHVNEEVTVGVDADGVEKVPNVAEE